MMDRSLKNGLKSKEDVQLNFDLLKWMISSAWNFGIENFKSRDSKEFAKSFFKIATDLINRSTKIIEES